MKKLSTILLGASLVLGSAAFAAQAGKDTKPATETSQTAGTKKHVRKHKKHSKKNAVTTPTPAPASTSKK